MIWSDIDVTQLYCDTADEKHYLSFSHPETTDPAMTSDSSTSSDSTTSGSSATSAAAASATAPSKRKQFTPGQYAGLSIGLVVVVAIIGIGLFVFFRKRKAAAAAGKRHTTAVEDKHNAKLAAAATPTDAATPSEQENFAAAALLGNSGQRADQGSPPAPMGSYTGTQAPRAPFAAAQAAATASPPVEAHGTASPVLQPPPPSTATSTVMSPMNSPVPSPSVSPVPTARNISMQPNTSRLSMSSSQFPPDGNNPYLAMPPFPITPPPDRRYSPSPDDIADGGIGPQQQPRSVPATGSGDLHQGQGPVGHAHPSSVYSGVYKPPKQLPSFSDPPFTQFNRDGRSTYIGGQAVPGMTASWFEDRPSIVNEMDANSGIGGAARQGGATAQGPTAAHPRIVSELMGSMPPTGR